MYLDTELDDIDDGNEWCVTVVMVLVVVMVAVIVDVVTDDDDDGNTIQLDCWRCVNEFVVTLELFDAIVPLLVVDAVVVVVDSAPAPAVVVAVAGVDEDDDDVPCGLNVTGTKCGVRLDIGGNIGLVGHWYDGVVADGSLLKMQLSKFFVLELIVHWIELRIYLRD